MIKLVISDMDGTFLNSAGDFNRPFYKEVKQLMDQQGVQFAACTGKQCERVEAIFGEEANDIWILGDSATRIKRKGEFVYESLLANEIGLALIKKIETVAPNVVIIACTANGAMVKKDITEDAIAIVRGSYHEVGFVEDYATITDDFVKITVYDKNLNCFETVKELETFTDKAYIVASEAAWIDVSNYDVHKGTTVKKLQAMLDVTADETMCFGDGLNDIELMEECTYSFAMRNGFEATKDVARFVTGTNDEEAVLHTIQEILALQTPSK